MLQAPRVAVFNGQTARVTDTSQTPFVVGVKEVEKTRVPQIRVVSEGTTLQLRPVADRSGNIHLDFAARFSKIRKVETVSFRDAPSVEVTIQVPEVAMLRLEGGVVMKSGQWVLLPDRRPRAWPTKASRHPRRGGIGCSAARLSRLVRRRSLFSCCVRKAPSPPTRGKPGGEPHGKGRQGDLNAERVSPLTAAVVFVSVFSCGGRNQRSRVGHIGRCAGCQAGYWLFMSACSTSAVSRSAFALPRRRRVSGRGG